MTRVRIDLFVSLDGYSSTTDQTPENPMGQDRGRLTAVYASTRTFRARIFGDPSGVGTTGIDELLPRRTLRRCRRRDHGAAMFGLHSFPDDPDWKR